MLWRLWGLVQFKEQRVGGGLLPFLCDPGLLQVCVQICAQGPSLISAPSPGPFWEAALYRGMDG